MHLDDRAVQMDPLGGRSRLQLDSLYLGEDARQHASLGLALAAPANREPGAIALRQRAPGASLLGDEQSTVKCLAGRELAVAARCRQQGSDPLPLGISQVHVVR